LKYDYLMGFFFFFGCFVLFETLRTILIDFCGSYIRVMEELFFTEKKNIYWEGKCDHCMRVSNVAMIVNNLRYLKD
jgi:hypothetical protein